MRYIILILLKILYYTGTGYYNTPIYYNIKYIIFYTYLQILLKNNKLFVQ